MGAKAPTMENEMNDKLIKQVNTKPQHCINRVTITQEQFDAILMNPGLVVVEKHFHNKYETSQVLFVIKDEEIDWIAVKEINENGTIIFKEV